MWRHILGRLTEHLKAAVESYLRGLKATGIGLERIPSLDEMNAKLSRLGWSAVSVRGFIPPAVFTELQSLGFWPSPRISAPSSTWTTRRPPTSFMKAPAMRRSFDSATPST